MSKHVDGIEDKCGDKGLHEFMNNGKELYTGSDGEELMKREVRCKDCNRKAMEYWVMVQRTETPDMYEEILDD